MSINKQLEELYNKKMGGVREMFKKYNVQGPLLMKCWEKDYLASNFKILIVGKECNGWECEDDVKILMDRYENFRLAKNDNAYRQFWDYSHWINRLLNPKQDSKLNFLWTNVSPFCGSDGEGLCWDIYEDCIKNHFKCLPDEIKITKPDVVILFTGTEYYDNMMNLQYDWKIDFKPVFEDIPAKELARLEHADLPFHTYRTYHPRYLQQFAGGKKDYYLEKLVEYIKEKQKNAI